ncbi:hypothetical protein ES332_A11G264700v1 [Gossypium tomentosum]|uniref:Uncharacterized protein n=1 Tax=Gossypium tomentosum TaxID=34277 RepID=A0A5D2NEB7_GOSTO|nr:hypothetical protein ES332_A11G264700v1 [Gossypium tomentosum]
MEKAAMESSNSNNRICRIFVENFPGLPICTINIAGHHHTRSDGIAVGDWLKVTKKDFFFSGEKLKPYRNLNGGFLWFRFNT